MYKVQCGLFLPGVRVCVWGGGGVITSQKGLCMYQLVNLKGFMTRMRLEGLGSIQTILV